MKKFIIPFALSFLSVSSFAQFKADTLSKDVYIDKIDNQLLSLNLLFPGVSFEQRVMKTGTLRLSTQLFPAIRISSFNGTELDWGQDVRLQFRYYYNLKDRQLLGRNVHKNSLNYFALQPSIALPYVSNTHATASATLLWGFQRSYSNWLLNLELGVSTLLSQNSMSETVFPYWNISFGYLLFKKLQK